MPPCRTNVLAAKTFLARDLLNTSHDGLNKPGTLSCLLAALVYWR